MKWKKNEAQNSEARVEKLADEGRSAAQQSMEALWSAFLEVASWTWCGPRRRPCGSW